MKPKKISTKLALYSILVLLALNLISAFFMGISTARSMNQKQDAYLKQTADSSAQQVAQYIETYVGITETLARGGQFKSVVTVEGAISAAPDFNGLVDTMQATMEAYPDILGMGFGSMSSQEYNAATVRSVAGAVQPFAHRYHHYVPVPVADDFV